MILVIFIYNFLARDLAPNVDGQSGITAFMKKAIVNHIKKINLENFLDLLTMVNHRRYSRILFR